MIGQTISHYRILEKLGEGGMGVVYKAEDTKLKRTVALKFLSPHTLGSEQEKTRFVHEAQAAAALDHPNICTVHEIDEAEGQTFIAMAYIDGQSLREKIESGPVKLEEALDAAIDVAQGLQEAHEKSIVHRDIKSSNVMVTNKGQAKITDFGLAKLAAGTKVTVTGTTVGTVAYMSPEQARGDEIDHRTDIWSLGVVVYEMLTGQLPFKGDYEQAVTYNIVHEFPEPITGLRTGIPLELERIVNKCIQKKPDDRYQHADEVVVDLRKVKEGLGFERVPSFVQKGSWSRRLLTAGVFLLLVTAGYVFFSRYLPGGSGEITSERKMLVVLPFENLGPAEDEYFADGITEEITVRLAAIHELGVIGRTSAIQYKNTDKNIQQIGEELGVEYIMEGTIRWQRTSKGASRVRVTPQLIRVSDATHLWADVYDEVLTEVFRVQSDIAGKVVSALDLTLLEPERELLESKPTDDLEAYDYYLRGNEYFQGIDDEKRLRLASQLYENAVELDSSFASAYAMLSGVYTELYWHHDRRGEDLARAKQALDKATELGADLPDVHVARGSYYYHQEDYGRALEEFELAREKRPNDADLLEQIGFVRRRQGLSELAIPKFKRAVELEPRSARKASNLGDTYLWMRVYTEAETYYDRAISLAPDKAKFYADKARLHILREGNTEAAQRLLQRASEVVEPTAQFSHVGAWVDACAGDYEAALTKLTADGPVFSSGAHYYNRAAMYGFLGKLEMERSYYDSARVMLEERVAAVPDDARYHGGLGIAYAGLGRKNDAIREGERAAKLAPISQDAFYNPTSAISLARIYVMVGEYEDAIDQLEYLLSIPAPLSIPSLRVDPTWAPLREHPRFQELLRG